MPTSRVHDEPIRRLYSTLITPGAPTDISDGLLTLNLRRGTVEILYHNENASTFQRLGLTPKILGVWWYDASANTWHDLIGPDKEALYSDSTGVRQFTLAAADYLYFHTTERVGGFAFTIDGTLLNAQAATITAIEYWASGGWTSTGATDHTASVGATFGQAGPKNIMFDSVPAATAWVSSDISKAGLVSYPPGLTTGYWCRMALATGTVLDAVEIEQVSSYMAVLPGNNTADTADAEMMWVKDQTEYTLPVDDTVQGIAYINSVDSTAGLASQLTFVIRDR